VKVEIRLLATLATYRPAGSPAEGGILNLPSGATVGQAMQTLGIPAEIDCLRIVNGLDAGIERPLADGDVLTLCPPLVGGS
jgi:hypothetical protein